MKKLRYRMVKKMKMTQVAKNKVSSENHKKGEAPSLVAISAQMAFVALASAFIYVFVSVAREAEFRHLCLPTCLLDPHYAGYERKAPHFELSDMTGKKVSLSDYKGKVVVLHFWTKTCAPCLEELPSLEEFAMQIKEQGDVVLLSVSADQGPEEVKKTFLTTLGTMPSFPVLFDPDGQEVILKKFGTSLFPETWIVDQDGVIRARIDGSRDWSSSIVGDYINQVRSRLYCPIEFKKNKAEGQGVNLCQNDS